MANQIFTVKTNTKVEDLGDNKEVYLDISLKPKMVNGEEQVAKSVNIDAVKNSIDNIFGFIPGERILDPEFGNQLRKYLYDGITTYNEEQIVAEIRRCLGKYEPRVNLVRVVNRNDIANVEDNTLILEIFYTIYGITDKLFSSQYTFDSIY